MPGFINHNVSSGVPGTPGPRIVRGLDENTPVFAERNYTLTGVTKDSTGAALASCTVRLFNASNNALEQTTTSDASGNYSFVVDKTQTYFEVAYKSGAPDVAGTTVRTLAGS